MPLKPGHYVRNNINYLAPRHVRENWARDNSCVFMVAYVLVSAIVAIFVLVSKLKQAVSLKKVNLPRCLVSYLSL